ncbi:DUF2332 family protein [Phenylobacterium sp.]|uniref:DUF2332 domain-containing protein n=1 Tax=Phenylobacterium sp. TaxID=1871053 RepID=UPI00121CCC90|nr:DUF2332 family protein [Phenylobacterium sp.]THD64428.1 MAG: DUF2332 family protein [Phenylobacterium sp.]
MSETAPVPDVVNALRLQAGICRQLGSPLNGGLLERAAEDWLADGPVKPLLAPWSGLDLRGQFDAATPLRLIGSWHELALSGDDPATARAYAALDAEAIWAAVRAAMAERHDRLAAFMAHEPQTNEVRRSACLLGGFLEAAKATGLPLRCFEIAASAGLNLSWDRYRYRLNQADMGEAAWGDPAAEVEIDTDWQGGLPPLDARIEVAERAACDRRRTDLRDPARQRRLMAYVWADQADRLARLRAAIQLALANDVKVDEADAVDWVRARVAPKPGSLSVLYHSVFWQYMPPESRAALGALIAEIGARATPQAPFAWLRMEPPMPNPGMEVRLTLWPGGEDRLLAEVHPHGAQVRWLGG